MQVNKTTINIVRNGLKKDMQTNQESLMVLSHKLKNIKSAEKTGNPFMRAAMIENFNREFNVNIPLNTPIETILDSFKTTKDKIDKDTKKSKTLIEALSRDGFLSITYNLPLVLLTSFGRDLSYSYLIITGIKTNSKKKSLDSELMDKIEVKMLQYERKMSMLINDDYAVSPSNIANFIDFFIDYITEFYVYYKQEFSIDVDFDIEKAMATILHSMIFYIIYSNTGQEVNEADKKEFIELCEEYAKKDTSTSRALADAGTKIIDKKNKEQEALKAKQKEKVVIETKKDDPLKGYVEDGLIVKSCNLEAFESLLNASSLTEKGKIELLAQMRNFINRGVQVEYESKMAALRKKFLSSSEQELYLKAKANPTLHSKVEDIDYLFESVLDKPLTDEDTIAIFEELRPLFSSLKSDLEPKREEAIYPSVLFFNETIENENGEPEQVPFILKSIIACRKGSYRKIYSTLSRILNGVVSQDNILQRDGLPCRVWYKGKDFKILYTVIDNVPIIIDGFRGENVPQRILDTLRSQKFIDYLKTLRESISKEKSICDSESLEMIKKELSKSPAVKNLKLF